MFKAEKVTTGLASGSTQFFAFKGCYQAIPAGFAFHYLVAERIFTDLLFFTPCYLVVLGFKIGNSVPGPYLCRSGGRY
jgi:hypothetical protein